VRAAWAQAEKPVDAHGERRSPEYGGLPRGVGAGPGSWRQLPTLLGRQAAEGVRRGPGCYWWPGFESTVVDFSARLGSVGIAFGAISAGTAGATSGAATTEAGPCACRLDDLCDGQGRNRSPCRSRFQLSCAGTGTVGHHPTLPRSLIVPVTLKVVAPHLGDLGAPAITLGQLLVGELRRAHRGMSLSKARPHRRITSGQEREPQRSARWGSKAGCAAQQVLSTEDRSGAKSSPAT
jgi:hypothetical protein